MATLIQARAAESASDGPALSPEELIRYSRHALLPEVGIEGQRRIKAARVLVVGLGGLGSPVALYLAAAGVGTLGLVDDDRVDASNLQRQLLHGTRDVGRSKLDSAVDRLYDVNPHVALERHQTRLTAANALDLIAQYDIVVDGTDNFATRYLVNDACVLTGRPNVYGSIFRFDGQVSVFCDPAGPCYRCLYPEPPPPGMVPSCAEGGVLGVLPGLVGVWQATEVLKRILGTGDALVGRLLLVDALGARVRTVKLRRDPSCPACGTRTLTALIDYDQFCGLGTTDAVPEITPREAFARWQSTPGVQLIDVREAQEHAISRIEGARLVPLATLPDVLDSLDRTRPTFVFCKVGARSARAVRYLREQQFTDVWNVAGGILRWSDDVDGGITKY
ncbi:MAG: putative adenylyltransferase/sulfurtransferase MoeZ [Gemmatimonadaceae bacterium]|nr:putative adenylyltransferase/sulfurtransferase MoeZ [Gemmatimonadaceae bacterium]